MKKLFAGLAFVTGLLVGVFGTDLIAQTIRLTDGTWGTKVVPYTLAGAEATSALESGGNLDAITTALQLIDNAFYLDDATVADATNYFALAGARAEAASTSTATDGDGGYLAMTLNRALKVTLFNSSGTELTATEVTEDATVTAGVTGPAVLTRRADTASSSAGSDNENAQLNTDSVGALWTHQRAIETYVSADLDESEEEVDDSAGEICGIWVTNTATATRFVRIYDADADDVTVGTTAANLVVGIPGNASDDVAGALGLPAGACRVYSNLSIAATTDHPDDGNPGAPGANEVIVTVFYRSGI